MKNIIASILLLALGAGCKSTSSQYTVVNNTPFMLKVYQDGAYKGELPPGLIHQVKGTLLWRNTIVTVTGVDSCGAFIGSGSFLYQFGVPVAWTVTDLTSIGQPYQYYPSYAR